MSSRNLVSRTFPQFYQSMLTAMLLVNMYTYAAFNLKRVPGALYTVSLIKLNRAL